MTSFEDTPEIMALRVATQAPDPAMAKAYEASFRMGFNDAMNGVRPEDRARRPEPRRPQDQEAYRRGYDRALGRLSDPRDYT